MFEGIEKVAGARTYRSAKQRWTGLQILFKAGQIQRSKTDEDSWYDRRLQQAQDDENMVGFNQVRHLKHDQRHLRSLLTNPTLKIGCGRKYNIKKVLEEALQFLDAREKFWASQ